MTAKEALAAALNSECSVKAPSGSDITHHGNNLWCGLSDEQKKLVGEAVRLAVEEAVSAREKVIRDLRAQVKLLQKRGAWR